MEEIKIYNILIVDDEELVRKSIIKVIDWEGLGFKKVYEAEDGKEALEICKNNDINLVLTDIEMPFMNGIELSEILNSKFPDIHVAILTGHEEFEYAKKSVDLGVNYYILKPVGSKTLYEKLKNILEKIDHKISQKKYIDKMKSQLTQSTTVLQEKFLYGLVCTDKKNDQNINERILSLKLNLRSSAYVVGIVDMDLSQVKAEDVDLFHFAIGNIVRDCLGSNHISFAIESNKVIVIFNLDFFEEDVLEIAYKTMQVIQKTIFEILEVNITCALGSQVFEIKELARSFNEAKTALGCRYSLGKNRVYDINDLAYIEKSFFYPTEEIKKLIHTIKYKDQIAVKESVNCIFNRLFSYKKLSGPNIKMLFVEIVTSILKELSVVKGISEDILDEGFGIYNQVEELHSVDMIIKRVVKFSINAQKELKKLYSSNSKSIIEKAKRFIEENYSDEDISLSSIAKHISVSTGYLSALFKKETNVNFVDYITKIRMEKAMELLKVTDKKIYQIADEVGFSNSHYFSIAFKKYTQMTPSEFQKKLKDKGEINEDN